MTSTLLSSALMAFYLLALQAGSAIGSSEETPRNRVPNDPSQQIQPTRQDMTVEVTLNGEKWQVSSPSLVIDAGRWALAQEVSPLDDETTNRKAPKTIDTDMGRLKVMPPSLQAGCCVERRGSDCMQVQGGAVRIGYGEAALLGANVGIDPTITFKQPARITFVLHDGKWYATSGRLGIRDSMYVLVAGHEVKVRGSRATPILGRNGPVDCDENTTLIVRESGELAVEKTAERRTTRDSTPRAESTAGNYVLWLVLGIGGIAISAIVLMLMAVRGMAQKNARKNTRSLVQMTLGSQKGQSEGEHRTGRGWPR